MTPIAILSLISEYFLLVCRTPIPVSSLISDCSLLVCRITNGFTRWFSCSVLLLLTCYRCLPFFGFFWVFHGGFPSSCLKHSFSFCCLLQCSFFSAITVPLIPFLAFCYDLRFHAALRSGQGCALPLLVGWELPLDRFGGLSNSLQSSRELILYLAFCLAFGMLVLSITLIFEMLSQPCTLGMMSGSSWFQFIEILGILHLGRVKTIVFFLSSVVILKQGNADSF